MASPEVVRPLRVFLSHSSEDRPTVRHLYRRLHADGFAAWLDEEELLPGQDWQQEIRRAVRASDVVLICLSRNSVTRLGYVQKEIKLSLDIAEELPEGTFFLIPVKLEDCEVPERLRRWQSVNLFEADGYERLMRPLSRRAETLTDSTTTSPAIDDRESLQRTLTLIRRELAVVEQQATSYTVLTLPIDIAVKLDEKRREIGRLEMSLATLQGHSTLDDDIQFSFVPANNIFLSYSRKDADIMLSVKSDLQREGFNIWVDETDLELGTPAWEAEIQDALERSSCLVVLMSPDSKRSIWVLRELSYAERRGIRIFPVLVRGEELDAVPFRLSSTMWVDARSDYLRALQRLVIAVRKQVGFAGIS
jgi:TIR domain